MCRATNHCQATELFRRIAAREEMRVQRGVAHLLGLAVALTAPESLGPRLTENAEIHDLFGDPDDHDSAPRRWM